MEAEKYKGRDRLREERRCKTDGQRQRCVWVCIYKYAYIYICDGEIVLVPLFAFSRVRTSTTLNKKLKQPQANQELENRTTGELETVPPQRSFFDPLGGTVPNS